jgi:hypothetical protein
MVMLRVDSRDVKLDNVNESWIVDQVERRRRDGICVNIRIIFREEEVIIAIVTPEYWPSGRPIEKPTERQKRVIDFWRQCNLDREDFRCDDLIHFLRRISALLN